MGTTDASHTVILDNYLPILLFILVGLAVGAAPMVIGALLGPRNPDPEKLSPYECGFEAFEDARMKFDVRYYLVAILFIIFDLEIAFLFPWGCGARRSWRLERWLLGDDGVSRHFDRWVYLRVEKGRPGLGISNGFGRSP